MHRMLVLCCLPLFLLFIFLPITSAAPRSLDYFTKTEQGHALLYKTAREVYGTQDEQALRRASAILSILISETGMPELKDIQIVFIPDHGIPNAHAIPSHIILLGQSAITLPDDEFAVLLAHELGHIALQHPVRILLRSQRALFLLSRISPDKKGIYTTKNARAFLEASRYGILERSDERAADTWAAALLPKAGVEPNAGVDLMDRLEKYYGNTNPVGAHLSWDERKKIFMRGISAASK